MRDVAESDAVKPDYPSKSLAKANRENISPPIYKVQAPVLPPMNLALGALTAEPLHGDYGGAMQKIGHDSHGGGTESEYEHKHPAAAAAGAATFASPNPTSALAKSSAAGSASAGKLTSAVSPLQAEASAQIKLISNDSVRSEAQVSRLAATRRKQINDQFSGIRKNFASFFAGAITGVQTAITTKQTDITSATSKVVQSVQKAVADALKTVQSQGDQIRQAITGFVQGVTASLQTKVQGITKQILGALNSIALPDLPGVEQIRSMASTLLQKAAGAVTAALSQVLGFINQTISSGMEVLGTLLNTVGTSVNQMLSAATAQIARVVQSISQSLSRVATLLISKLRSVLTSSLNPALSRVENSIVGALAKAEKQALTSLRNNREQHLKALTAALHPPAGGGNGNGQQKGGSASSGVEALRAIGRDAVNTDRSIVQTFEEKTSGAIALLTSSLTARVAQIVQGVTSTVAQAVQAVTEKVTQFIAGFQQLVQAVTGFIQSLLQSLATAVSGLFDSIKSLVQNPADKLLDFAQNAWSKITGFISSLVRNLISGAGGIASSVQNAIGDFALSKGPITKPRPGPITLPGLEKIFLVFLVVGVIVLAVVPQLGVVVAALVALGLSEVGAIVVIGVVVVALLLALLLLLLYLLSRLLKPKPVPKPPGCTPSPPVPFPPGSSTLHGPVAPSIPLGPNDYGLTFPEGVQATISARCDGTRWFPVLTSLIGDFSEQVRLLPGQKEVTGPGGNTTKTNFCDQATELHALGFGAGHAKWYMVSAVQAHEDVHLTRFQPALVAKARVIEATITSLSVPDAPGKTPAQATAELRALPGFPAALATAQGTWLTEILVRVRGDHAKGGPCDQAEHRVVDPMVSKICKHAKANNWGPCPICPP